MRNLIILPLLAILGSWLTVEAAFQPCLGKAFLGEDCDFDADCGSFGTFCIMGKCDCNPSYDRVKETDKNGVTRESCKKLPDKFGQECDKKCAEPLYCENNKCICKYSQRKGDTCELEIGINDRCTKHTDCTQPFTACVGNKCICIAGTTNFRNTECRADKQCPFGGSIGPTCVRGTSDPTVFTSAPGGDLTLDTCPVGQFCHTAEGSLSGHCCKATCPLGSNPNIAYSCEKDATNPCPSKTHFCHKVAGSAWGFSVCCNRPCENGGHLGTYNHDTLQCQESGFLNGPCTKNADCDAEATMACVNNTCTCYGTFEPETDAFSDAIANPPHRCRRECRNSGGRANQCYGFGAALNAACTIQEQCPTGSACFRGRCTCRCGYNLVNGRCEMPTTPPPTTTPANRNRGSSAATAPPLQNLFNGFNFQSFLGGAGGNAGNGGGLGGLGNFGGGLGGGSNLFTDLVGKLIPGGK